MKKVFLTGIAGFIGFHLASYLKRKGYAVSGVDLFTPYYNVELKKARASLLKELGVEVLTLDINETSSLQNLLQKTQSTHVIHLAAQPGVRHPDTFEYVRQNLNGFVSLLEALKKTSVEKLLFASSSSVYGKNQKIPFEEMDPVHNPANFYGATKTSNELMARSIHHITKLPMIGFRFFTVYGPWGRPDMAYFSFTEKICKGKELTLYAKGEMRRDFTYVDDLLSPIEKALDLPVSFEIFNLGCNHPHSVLDMVSHLENNLGKKAKKTFLEAPVNEPFTTYAGISKANKLLGFSPSTSLEKGLFSFTQWYQQEYLAAFSAL